ncbi:S-adenosyl-L-methionine-dependent methyltransferase [Xylariaceae sp. FL0594]|nr:S-adenosyl-L-methionine-dependent methyltransferase [Xylariaceae sp. FL0594]
MSTNNDSPYVLNETEQDGLEQERDRLNIQHYWFDDILSNELLPRHILDQLTASPSPPRLAKTFPTPAELLGLDYDVTEFSDVLPSNVTLKFGDAFQPFPADLQNSFDVVHLRYFVWAVKSGQVVALVRNLMSLLRPGGWLVWVDHNPVMIAVEPPDHAFYRWQKAYYDFASKAGLDFKEAGLTNADERNYCSTAVHYRPGGETNSRPLRGIYLSGGVDGLWTQADLDKFTSKLEEMLTGTRKIHMLVTQAWGQKGANQGGLVYQRR